MTGITIIAGRYKIFENDRCEQIENSTDKLEMTSTVQLYCTGKHVQIQL